MLIAILLAAVAIAIQAGPSFVQRTSRSTNWRALHRPLHLPKLDPRTPCPVSTSHAISVALRHRILNGGGPGYLMSVGDSRGGVIDISESSPDAVGWYGQKTPWLVKSLYRGPILIRGQQLGRPGEVRFARSSGQHLIELRWPAGLNQGPSGDFRFLASESLFRSTGCYGFQLDGTSFSEAIVVRVVRGRWG